MGDLYLDQLKIRHTNHKKMFKYFSLLGLASLAVNANDIFEVNGVKINLKGKAFLIADPPKSAKKYKQVTAELLNGGYWSIIQYAYAKYDGIRSSTKYVRDKICVGNGWMIQNALINDANAGSAILQRKAGSGSFAQYCDAAGCHLDSDFRDELQFTHAPEGECLDSHIWVSNSWFEILNAAIITVPPIVDVDDEPVVTTSVATTTTEAEPVVVTTHKQQQVEVIDPFCLDIKTGDWGDDKSSGDLSIVASFSNSYNGPVLETINFDISGPFNHGDLRQVCETPSKLNGVDDIHVGLTIQHPSNDGHKITSLKSRFGDEEKIWTFNRLASFWVDGNNDSSDCQNGDACTLDSLKDPFCIDIETGVNDESQSSANLYIAATFIDNDNGNGPVLEVINFDLEGPFNQGDVRQVCKQTSKLYARDDIHVNLSVKHPSDDGHEITSLKTSFGDKVETWAYNGAQSFWVDGNDDTSDGNCQNGKVCTLDSFKDPFCIDIKTGAWGDDKSSGDLSIVATFRNNYDGPVLEVINFDMAGPFNLGDFSQACAEPSKFNGNDDIYFDLTIQHPSNDGHKIDSLTTRLGDKVKDWTFNGEKTFWVDGNDDSNGCQNGDVCTLDSFQDLFCVNIETGLWGDDQSSGDLFVVASFRDNDNGPVFETINFDIEGSFGLGNSRQVCKPARELKGKDDVHVELTVRHPSTDGHKIDSFKTRLGDRQETWSYNGSKAFWVDGNNDSDGCQNGDACALEIYDEKPWSIFR